VAGGSCGGGGCGAGAGETGGSGVHAIVTWPSPPLIVPALTPAANVGLVAPGAM
jgi:hypothetical protein